MTGITSTAANGLELLWEAELFLRRQLQQVPEDVSVTDSKDPYAQPPSSQQATGHEETSSQSRGRTVLTILYLSVLGLCFVVPVFYYFRLHCFEENARRELELDFTAALEQSEQHREDSRAARRKYVEERRARIVQLLGPVRMVLKAENFPHFGDFPDDSGKSRAAQLPRVSNLDIESEELAKPSDKESATMASEDVLSPCTSNYEDDQKSHDPSSLTHENAGNIRTKEKEVIESTGREGDEEHHNNKQSSFPRKKEIQRNPYGDEDTSLVSIPAPGIPLGRCCLLDPTRTRRRRQNDDCEREMRVAPGLCTICLSNYKVGSDVVWSSNESCDHHFHFSCIEKWLMKQREGPLCPCCRRDFVVDPLDFSEDELSIINSESINASDRPNEITEEIPVSTWYPTSVHESVNDDGDDDDSESITVTGQGGSRTVVNDETHLEEGVLAFGRDQRELRLQLHRHRDLLESSSRRESPSPSNYNHDDIPWDNDGFHLSSTVVESFHDDAAASETAAAENDTANSVQV